MNERQFELLQYAMHIMETRATDPDRGVETRIAYDSAICMIGYALNENYECLAQFDYTDGCVMYELSYICPEGVVECDVFKGTWYALQQLIRRLREQGCKDISAARIDYAMEGGE